MTTDPGPAAAPSASNPSSAERDLTSQVRLTHAVYILLAASLVIPVFTILLVPVTAIIGVIINYVKRDDVRGIWLESHFDWQIVTFWAGAIALVSGWLFNFTIIGIPLGFMIWGVGAIWVIYRIIKGWIKLNERKPVGV